MIAKFKARKKSWVWREHEFVRPVVKSLYVLVPSWFSTTELADTRGLGEVIPSSSPGLAQGCQKGSQGRSQPFHLPSHQPAARSDQGKFMGCGIHHLIPTPSVQLAVSFCLLQPRTIYLDLNNNKKHIVKSGSVLTVKHSHIITTAQQQ